MRVCLSKQINQQVTFVTDGGNDVRELPLSLNPQAEHLLDWFPVTIGQLAKSLPVARAGPSGSDTGGIADFADEEAEAGEEEPGFVVTRAEAARELERLKWFLWYGNVFRARQVIAELKVDLDVEHPSPEQQKLLKAVTEFGGYLRANGAWIPNDGERYRAGDTISSAFVESTVNQVVSKRMVKKQQMRWSPRGAHLLVQVRTRVLNNDLVADFRRWYPTFTRPNDEREVAA